VEPETLVPAAKTLAARIASRSPQAIRLAKRLLKAGARSDLQSVLDLSAGYNAMLHQTDAHKEAVQNLLEQTRQRRAAREQTS
jgi:enoyl-CoA hydratase/carnithine racemase